MISREIALEVNKTALVFSLSFFLLLPLFGEEFCFSTYGLGMVQSTLY